MSREVAATEVQLLTRDEDWVEVENLRGAVRENRNQVKFKGGGILPATFLLYTIHVGMYLTRYG